MKLFYKIWAEAFTREEKLRGKKDSKLYAFLFITFCQVLNIFSILLYLKILFDVHINLFYTFQFLPGKILNGMLSGIVTLVLPCFLLNYFLVFRAENYKRIMERYSNNNFRHYLAYVIFSIAIFLIPILIGFILSRM